MTRLRFAAPLLAGLGLALAVVAAPVPKDKAENFGPVTDEQLKESENNVKQILLAFHNYESAMGVLPNNFCDGEGKPILSWRVLILPYLEESPLYLKFKLDEPWDSKNNAAMIDDVPKTYQPVRVKTKEKGMTFYRGFSGKDAMFEVGQRIRIAGITDGTSNTVGVVEAGVPCVWTKPDDLPFDPEKPLPKLGGLFDGTFHVGLMDGSVRRVKGKWNEAALKAAITRSGGEVIDIDAGLGK